MAHFILFPSRLMRALIIQNSVKFIPICATSDFTWEDPMQRFDGSSYMSTTLFTFKAHCSIQSTVKP